MSIQQQLGLPWFVHQHIGKFVTVKIGYSHCAIPGGFGGTNSIAKQSFRHTVCCLLCRFRLQHTDAAIATINGNDFRTGPTVETGNRDGSRSLQGEGNLGPQSATGRLQSSADRASCLFSRQITQIRSSIAVQIGGLEQSLSPGSADQLFCRAHAALLCLTEQKHGGFPGCRQIRPPVTVEVSGGKDTGDRFEARQTHRPLFGPFLPACLRLIVDSQLIRRPDDGKIHSSVAIKIPGLELRYGAVHRNPTIFESFVRRQLVDLSTGLVLCRPLGPLQQQSNRTCKIVHHSDIRQAIAVEVT